MDKAAEYLKQGASASIMHHSPPENKNDGLISKALYVLTHIGRIECSTDTLLLGIALIGMTVFTVIPFLPRLYWPQGEFGYTELLTAYFYVCGFLFCLYRITTKNTNNLLLCVLWCLLTFIFSGEELSWLQHILKYQTPASIAAINYQNEFNIHNLDVFKSGSWHTALTANNYNLKLFLGPQNIFRLGFFSYFLAFPLLLKFFKERWSSLERFAPIAPQYNLVVTILFVMIFSVIAYFLNTDARDNITETRELFYALFILFYINSYLGKQSIEYSPHFSWDSFQFSIRFNAS